MARVDRLWTSPPRHQSPALRGSGVARVPFSKGRRRAKTLDCWLETLRILSVYGSHLAHFGDVLCSRRDGSGGILDAQRARRIIDPKLAGSTGPASAASTAGG